MLIEEALTAYLNANADIYAYTSGRVYPFHKLQDDQLPAITYHRVFSARDYEMEGSVNLVDSRYQIDIWTRTYKDGKEIAEILRKILSGFRGTWSSVQVYGVFQLNDSDMAGDLSAGIQLDQYRVMQEYRILYNETETAQGAYRS